MSYTLQIGLRYLRSKRRGTISLITGISIVAVALGVAAFLCVRAITGGFQEEFRNKVLGVNAHVIVLKYGVDFDEYREVMEKAREQPEVAGVGPFLIREMMLAKGDRLSGVLVKGIDPQGAVDVLDLPDQIVDGSLAGLRRDGAAPPLRPGDIHGGGSSASLRQWLEATAPDDPNGPLGADEGPDPLEGIDRESLMDHVLATDGSILDEEGRLPGSVARLDSDSDSGPAAPPSDYEPLPEVQTLSPDAVEALLAGGDAPALPDGPEWDEAFAADQAEIDRQAEEGTADLPGIVVGRTLARTLGLGVGDRVTLVSPLTGLDVASLSPGARAPQSVDFRVIAIFEAGFQEYDSRLVYTDLYEAQRFYQQGDSVTGVEMKLHDLDRSREVARRLERELGGPFHTLDWAELNRNLFTALETQKIILSLVIATLIFVAAFTVIATLIMIVLEKKREIAILKAMGATDLSVLLVFMVQGVVIGVVGTLAGLALGGTLVAALYYVHLPLDPKVYLIDHLPVVMNLWEFSVTVLVAMLICTFATVAPSYWAARMLPVEGLRYE